MKSKTIFFSILLLLVVISGSFLGCVRKGKPAKPAGFVQIDLMTKPSDLPFNNAWWKSDFDEKRYTEIYIATVHTEYLLEMNWIQKVGRGYHIKQDIVDLAVYTQDAFKNAFLNDPNKRFKVVEKPGPNTLVLEIALVEVVPNKAVLETLSYAMGPLIKVVGSVIGTAIRQTSRSSVAFEARLIDGTSDEAVAMFADREEEKASLMSVKNLTWYGHAKSIINEWADQFVQVLNKKPGEVIKDSRPFELKPW